MSRDLVAEFCAARHAYNSISKSRRRQQPKVLRLFEASLDGRDVVDATAADLTTYLGSRVAAGKAPNTVLKDLKMIRPLFTWMWEQHLIDAERLMRVRAVRPPRGTTPFGTPRPYKKGQVEQLLRELEAAYPWIRPQDVRDGTPDLARAAFFLERWRRGQSRWSRVQPYFQRVQIEAIVALGLYGGIRLDEVWRVTLDHLHPDNDYVVVYGAAKNREGKRRERAVPWMRPEMRTAVDRWVAAREELAPPHDFPWLSLHTQAHHLKPMQERTFRMLLTDLGSGWEYHRLRHTAITAMVRAMPHKLHHVQRIAGHSRLAQTLAYAEMLPGDFVESAAQAESALARLYPQREAA